MKQNRLKSHTPGKPLHLGRKFLLFLLLIIAVTAVLGWVVLFETEKPLAGLSGNIEFLGKKTEIPFSASDRKSGLRSVVISVEQNGSSSEIFRREYPRQNWLKKAGPAELQDKALFELDRAKMKEGRAEIVITARDFSLNSMLKGNVSEIRQPVMIDTQPPRVLLQHTQRYIRNGGSGIVVYDLSEASAIHGAEVNGHFFPGYPIPGRENRYISYIALAWDTETLQGSSIIARDQAGNEGRSPFSMVLKKVPLKSDRINVSDGFLNAKIPEFEQFYPMEGTMVEKYLYVNNEIRNLNADKIKQLSGKSQDEQLWQDSFIRMSGQQMAGYAEQRTYHYQSNAIDNQVHLGIDIASTANAEIKAANRGKVVFAEYLGIYGYTVIIDHGQGVFSLYSHLSRIETAVGQMVDKGAVIAYSGATGMAGGDHLHFSMLINGFFVTPIEWWDQHWLDVNILDILEQL